jgi:cytochrome c oxidase assembly factor CtaG
VLILGHGTFSHDKLGDWALDPVSIVAASVGLALYANGWRPGNDGRRAVAFVTGGIAGLVAVVSPIHVAAEQSLTWHMAQHILLVGVAAPLLAVSAPGGTLLRGMGRGAAGVGRRLRRWGGFGPDRLRRLRSPIGRWLVFVVVFWGWHTARLYALAIEHAWVHPVEHVSFLVVSLAVWSSVLGPARTSGGADPAMRVMVVFLLGLQGVILSALMTFSPQPWYSVYVDSLGADALADQRLAGVLMWIPLGALYTTVGIWATMNWLGPDD